MRSFTVDVTKELITLGRRKDSRYCPVARALQEQHGARSIVIDSSIVKFNIGNTRYFFRPPAVAAKFIFDYDEEGVKEPLKFRLHKSQGMSQAVQYHGPKGPYKKRKNKVSRKPPTAKRSVFRTRGVVGIEVPHSGQKGH